MTTDADRRPSLASAVDEIQRIKKGRIRDVGHLLDIAEKRGLLDDPVLMQEFADLVNEVRVYGRAYVHEGEVVIVPAPISLIFLPERSP